MSERKPTPAERAQHARGAFMVRVGQVGRTARNQRCEHTLPLIPLVLILDADGTLAADARWMVEKISA